MPTKSCRVLAVRPALNRPQVISTSGHIMQGMMDLREEKWDAASRTLSGRSRVVGGDRCELRLVAPSPEKMWAVEACEVSAADRTAGVRATVKQAEGLVRANILSPAGREVSWSVRFL